MTKEKKPKITPSDSPPESKSYFQQFCEDYHITEKNNTIQLKTEIPGEKRRVSVPCKIFSEDKEGNLDMLVYTLRRETISYDNPNANPLRPNINNNRDLLFYIKRYHTPKIITDDKTGKTEEKKYHIPKGAGTHPFICESIIKKWEDKTPIDTLVLTEGYKKAWLGCYHGMDVIGLSSITHFKEKGVNTLYRDILDIIIDCAVKNIIMLYDGDCLNISDNALATGDDLYTRPAGFYMSAMAVKELLKDYLSDDLSLYFAHVKSDSVKDHPKGLDDLLLCKKGHEKEVCDDLNLFSAEQKYFYKQNITHSVAKLTFHFHFTSALDFFHAHEHWIQGRKFKYRGTTFEYKESTDGGELQTVVPKEAMYYFRVGINYYKYITIPNKYNQLEKTFHPWTKQTILDDHPSKKDKIFDNIQKYEAFCNVPDHVNFSRTLHNCFNMYAEFEHKPAEGDCTKSLDFVRHIFEEHYDLGLDYLQLLYQKPTQILPILCLISEENQTGKTTFVKWLKSIFTSNAAVIGNDELNNQFNLSYASKLIVACEESFINKKETMEKIKNLSTGDKIFMNAKGKDHVEIDFFGKFILCSNNENYFILAGKNDIRFWIRKIKPIEKINTQLLDDLYEEIPAFLHFLNKRKMSTENLSRMWFLPELIKTSSFFKLIEANRPKIEKEIISAVKELFINTGENVLYLPLIYIHQTMLNKKYPDYQVKKTLDSLHVPLLTDAKGISQVKKVTLIHTDGSYIFEDKSIRPYVFQCTAFLSSEEQILYGIDPYKDLDEKKDHFTTGFETKQIVLPWKKEKSLS